MPYKISKQNILNKLPAHEQGSAEQVGQQLLDQAGGICYLCWGRLLPASEFLYADHVKAEAEGGKTEIANLRLVHLSCNSAKKDKNPQDVIPYLRLKRFIQENGSQLKYGEITKHFKIEPSETQIEDEGSTLTLNFADGTSTVAQVISDAAGDRTIRYAFVSLPRCAIFNDDLVQPRSIKVEHANAIFLDLGKNPLHEPPGCRTDPDDKVNLKRIRMFDGQHKTIASWMRDREHITAKLYLDMTAARANELVVAIQSRVKKLSLTPFESAAKMSDEWKTRIAEYTEEMRDSGKPVSESGYIKWLPQGKSRTDGTTALKNALLQQVLDEKTFNLATLVDPPGKKVTGLTETMLKKSFLEKLLVMTPSDEPIEKSDEMRSVAVANIVWMANTFLEALVDDNGGEITPNVVSRKRSRFFNQNTLEQVADLMRIIFVRENEISDKAHLSVDLSAEVRAKIQEKIIRLASHPWWTAEWDKNSKMKALYDANRQNQDREKAFNGIAFDVTFARVGAEDNTAYAALWKRHEDSEDLE